MVEKFTQDQIDTLRQQSIISRHCFCGKLSVICEEFCNKAVTAEKKKEKERVKEFRNFIKSFEEMLDHLEEENEHLTREVKRLQCIEKEIFKVEE